MKIRRVSAALDWGQILRPSAPWCETVASILARYHSVEYLNAFIFVSELLIRAAKIIYHIFPAGGSIRALGWRWSDSESEIETLPGLCTDPVLQPTTETKDTVDETKNCTLRNSDKRGFRLEREMGNGSVLCPSGKWFQLFRMWLCGCCRGFERIFEEANSQLENQPKLLHIFTTSTYYRWIQRKQSHCRTTYECSGNSHYPPQGNIN